MQFCITDLYIMLLCTCVFNKNWHRESTRVAKPFGILKEEHLGKACVLHPGVHHLPSLYFMNVCFLTQCPTQNRSHLITIMISSKHHLLHGHTNNVHIMHLQRFNSWRISYHANSWDAKCKNICWWNHHYLQFTPKKNNACIFAVNTFTSDSLSSEPPQEISTEFTPIQTLECMHLKSMGFAIIHCIRNKSFTSNRLSDRWIFSL